MSDLPDRAAERSKDSNHVKTDRGDQFYFFRQKSCRSLTAPSFKKKETKKQQDSKEKSDSSSGTAPCDQPVHDSALPYDEHSASLCSGTSVPTTVTTAPCKLATSPPIHHGSFSRISFSSAPSIEDELRLSLMLRNFDRDAVRSGKSSAHHANSHGSSDYQVDSMHMLYRKLDGAQITPHDGSTLQARPRRRSHGTEHAEGRDSDDIRSRGNASCGATAAFGPPELRGCVPRTLIASSPRTQMPDSVVAPRRHIHVYTRACHDATPRTQDSLRRHRFECVTLDQQSMHSRQSAPRMNISATSLNDSFVTEEYQRLMGAKAVLRKHAHQSLTASESLLHNLPGVLAPRQKNSTEPSNNSCSSLASQHSTMNSSRTSNGLAHSHHRADRTSKHKSIHNANSPADRNSLSRVSFFAEVTPPAPTSLDRLPLSSYGGESHQPVTSHSGPAPVLSWNTKNNNNNNTQNNPFLEEQSSSTQPHPQQPTSLSAEEQRSSQPQTESSRSLVEILVRSIHHTGRQSSYIIADTEANFAQSGDAAAPSRNLCNVHSHAHSPDSDSNNDDSERYVVHKELPQRRPSHTFSSMLQALPAVPMQALEFQPRKPSMSTLSITSAFRQNKTSPQYRSSNYKSSNNSNNNNHRNDNDHDIHNDNNNNNYNAKNARFNNISHFNDLNNHRRVSHMKQNLLATVSLASCASLNSPTATLCSSTIQNSESATARTADTPSSVITALCENSASRDRVGGNGTTTVVAADGVSSSHRIRENALLTDTLLRSLHSARGMTAGGGSARRLRMRPSHWHRRSRGHRGNSAATSSNGASSAGCKRHPLISSPSAESGAPSRQTRLHSCRNNHMEDVFQELNSISSEECTCPSSCSSNSSDDAEDERTQRKNVKKLLMHLSHDTKSAASTHAAADHRAGSCSSRGSYYSTSKVTNTNAANSTLNATTNSCISNFDNTTSFAAFSTDASSHNSAMKVPPTAVTAHVAPDSATPIRASRIRWMGDSNSGEFADPDNTNGNGKSAMTPVTARVPQPAQLTEGNTTATTPISEDVSVGANGVSSEKDSPVGGWVGIGGGLLGNVESWYARLSRLEQQEDEEEKKHAQDKTSDDAKQPTGEETNITQCDLDQSLLQHRLTAVPAVQKPDTATLNKAQEDMTASGTHETGECSRRSTQREKIVNAVPAAATEKGDGVARTPEAHALRVSSVTSPRHSVSVRLPVAELPVPTQPFTDAFAASTSPAVVSPQHRQDTSSPIASISAPEPASTSSTLDHRSPHTQWRAMRHVTTKTTRPDGSTSSLPRPSTLAMSSTTTQLNDSSTSAALLNVFALASTVTRPDISSTTSVTSFLASPPVISQLSHTVLGGATKTNTSCPAGSQAQGARSTKATRMGKFTRCSLSQSSTATTPAKSASSESPSPTPDCVASMSTALSPADEGHCARQGHEGVVSRDGVTTHTSTKTMEEMGWALPPSRHDPNRFERSSLPSLTVLPQSAGKKISVYNPPRKFLYSALASKSRNSAMGKSCVLHDDHYNHNINDSVHKNSSISKNNNVFISDCSDDVCHDCATTSGAAKNYIRRAFKSVVPTVTAAATPSSGIATAAHVMRAITPILPSHPHAPFRVEATPHTPLGSLTPSLPHDNMAAGGGGFGSVSSTPAPDGALLDGACECNANIPVSSTSTRGFEPTINSRSWLSAITTRTDAATSAVVPAVLKNAGRSKAGLRMSNPIAANPPRAEVDAIAGTANFSIRPPVDRDMLNNSLPALQTRTSPYDRSNPVPMRQVAGSARSSTIDTDHMLLGSGGSKKCT